MTIGQYAADRGISYDMANRATHAVFQQIGKSVVAGRKGTELSESDIVLIDEYRAEGGNRRTARRERFEQTFEANRQEWLTAWTGYMTSAPRELRLTASIIVLVLRYTPTRWTLSRPVTDSKRVGDIVVAICCASAIESQENGQWSGFTAWLLENGYGSKG